MGSSPPASAANQAVRALAKLMRAFGAEAFNEALLLRLFNDTRVLVEQALTHGPLALEVRSVELRAHGELVYREPDRERSLAWVLSRDGVTNLTLAPGLAFGELGRLVEVLALRHAALREGEEDVSTLLARAPLPHVRVTATPLPPPPQPNFPIVPPADFDLPLPSATVASWSPREVPAPWLQSTLAEEQSAHAVPLAVKLLLTLLREANGPASPLTNAEILGYCHETVQLCVTEGAVTPLLAAVRELKAHHGIGADALAEVVAGAATRESITRLIHGLPPTLTETPVGFAELLSELPNAPLEHVVNVLNETEDPRLQRVLNGAIVGVGHKSSDSIVHALPAANTHSASQLINALLATHPEHALSAAQELVKSEEPETRLKALTLLERAPRSAEQSELLVQLANTLDDAVFTRAAQVMAAVRDRRGFDTLTRQAETRAQHRRLSPRAAEAVGEALALLAPTAALPLLKAWALPRGGLLGKLLEADKETSLQRAAVSGLALLPSPEAEAVLKELHAHAPSESVKQWCVAALARRRKASGGPAHG